MNAFLVFLSIILAALSYVCAIVFGMQRSDVDLGKMPKHAGWLTFGISAMFLVVSLILMRNAGRVF